MNLQKLFEIQAELDCHINNEHPVQEGEDRLAKKILALQVELGELCNCWRGFKFWSNDQETRTKVTCQYCDGRGYFDTGLIEDGMPYTEGCAYCQGTGYEEQKNPLLEEFVDCLHFILSIGLEIGVCPEELDAEHIFCANVTEQFIDLFYEVSRLRYEERNGQLYEDYFQYNIALEHFVGLGKMLGFTWEQIEQEYLEKTLHKSILTKSNS